MLAIGFNFITYLTIFTMISPKWQHCRKFVLLPAMLAKRIPVPTMLIAASLNQS